MCVKCMTGPREAREWHKIPLELELQMVMSCPVGVGNCLLLCVHPAHPLAMPTPSSPMWMLKATPWAWYK